MASLRITFIFVIASICSASALAHAQDPAPPPGYEALPPPAPAQQASPAAPVAPAPAPIEDEGHVVSITFSPIHLLFPIGEVTAEFRLGERMGIAGIVGGGTITVTDGFGDSTTFTALEIGAQFRYYLVGDFDHGMQLGAEVLFVHVSGEVDGGVTGTGSGLGVGPFVGYKYSAPFGFTFDAQLGIAAVGIGAQATDGTTTETRDDSFLGVILNLNVGWSF